MKPIEVTELDASRWSAEQWARFHAGLDPTDWADQKVLGITGRGWVWVAAFSMSVAVWTGVIALVAALSM